MQRLLDGHTDSDMGGDGFPGHAQLVGGPAEDAHQEAEGQGQGLGDGLHWTERVTKNDKHGILWTRQNGRCFYCGRGMKWENGLPTSKTLDHIVPRSLFPKGYEHWLEGNVVLACGECNNHKGNLILGDPDEGKWSGPFMFDPEQGWTFHGYNREGA